MSPIAAAVLRSIVLPAVLVGFAILWTGGLNPRWRRPAQAMILGLGFVLGNFLLLGHLNLPPEDVNESLSYVAVVAVAFGWVGPRSTGARYLGRALVVLGCLYLLLHRLPWATVVKS